MVIESGNVSDDDGGGSPGCEIGDVSDEGCGIDVWNVQDCGSGDAIDAGSESENDCAWIDVGNGNGNGNL